MGRLAGWRADVVLGLGLLDEVEARDIGQLDVHDDQAGHEFARAVERVQPVGHGFDRIALAFQHVAEQLPVEVVVLDNHDALCHAGLIAPSKGIWQLPLRPSSPDIDPYALALAALGWVLGDADRAGRLLALTGLTPDALREGLGDGAVLGAVIDFLGAHEPDLVAAAEALGVAPADLAAVGEKLNR